uniref:Uncharacterized protein n=1 Tax=Panagrolaimus davidi TaxID=227884 RepID=A0A914PQL4_9BILA
MHFLDDEISVNSISKFLLNFHERKLKPVKMNEKSVKKFMGKNVQSFEKLNAFDFENLLETKRKHDSVVFFTGGLTHGPSASISYILHTVASYFSDFNDHIKFYLIDASANDLPFQYTFDRLPAIVFIPPLHSTIGGARYPHILPISVPNLLAFFLSRSQPELRWRIALSSCSSECIKRNRLELHRFLSLLDLSIRKLRTTRSHLIRSGHGHDASAQAAFIRIALHRRILQRTAAVHLDNVLQLLASNDRIGNNLKFDETNQIIKQSLFIRWILYNHFGL